MSTELVDKQIAVTEKTRDRLRARKRGGDRYEDVIRRLLGENENGGQTSDSAEIGKP